MNTATNTCPSSSGANQAASVFPKVYYRPSGRAHWTVSQVPQKQKNEYRKVLEVENNGKVRYTLVCDHHTVAESIVAAFRDFETPSSMPNGPTETGDEFHDTWSANYRTDVEEGVVGSALSAYACAEKVEEALRLGKPLRLWPEGHGDPLEFVMTHCKLDKRPRTVMTYSFIPYSSYARITDSAHERQAKASATVTASPDQPGTIAGSITLRDADGNTRSEDMNWLSTSRLLAQVQPAASLPSLPPDLRPEDAADELLTLCKNKVWGPGDSDSKQEYHFAVQHPPPGLGRVINDRVKVECSVSTQNGFSYVQ